MRLAGDFVGKPDGSYVFVVDRRLILVTGANALTLGAGSFLQVRKGLHSTDRRKETQLALHDA